MQRKSGGSRSAIKVIAVAAVTSVALLASLLTLQSTEAAAQTGPTLEVVGEGLDRARDGRIMVEEPGNYDITVNGSGFSVETVVLTCPDADNMLDLAEGDPLRLCDLDKLTTGSPDKAGRFSVQIEDVPIDENGLVLAASDPAGTETTAVRVFFLGLIVKLVAKLIGYRSDSATRSALFQECATLAEPSTGGAGELDMRLDINQACNDGQVERLVVQYNPVVYDGVVPASSAVDFSIPNCSVEDVKVRVYISDEEFVEQPLAVAGGACGSLAETGVSATAGALATALLAAGTTLVVAARRVTSTED